ncbi:hypothetical protein HPB48_014263 [Haemaphysalis longicornis]|uniref:Uncharacterized protein n=1 Tax=Haemaphysalis longicornis TaxID=44386 RepID=A0A9J6FJ36_HAELO|nr:hypothetical protein HPB48_014263 [Haemaphysalis longicornis]
METLRQALSESMQQNLELQSSLNAIKEQMTAMRREQQSLQEQVGMLAARVEVGQQQYETMAEGVDARLDELLARSWSQGKFVWYIKPFSVLRRQQESGEIDRVVSAPFYTGVPGYKLAAHGRPQRLRRGPRKPPLAFSPVVSTDVLHGVCTFRTSDRTPRTQHVLRVVDQSGRGLHVERQQSFRSIPSKSKHLMGRPLLECNVPIGFHTMAPLDELNSERSRFVRNDTIVIVYRCRI